MIYVTADHFKEMHGRQALSRVIAFAVPPVRIPKYTSLARKAPVNIKKRVAAHRPNSHRIAHRKPFVSMTNQRFSSAETIEWLETPIAVSGKVQRGFGRGSRDLGTPTANLPGELVDGIDEVKRDGVYLGYGIVPKYGSKVVKMVANLGRNITYGDVEERVLEAYLMTEEYEEEFYGEEMKLCIIGFMRPEWKFTSIEELIAHIRNDVAVSEAALELSAATEFRSHPSLKVGKGLNAQDRYTDGSARKI